MWMFHNRTLNNMINRLHERAIHECNLQTLAIEMYKLKNNLSPKLMQSLFTISTNPYKLRNNQTFYADNIDTVSNGSETISSRGPKTWDVTPAENQNSLCLHDFKRKIRKWKPQGCSCRLCKLYISSVGFI